MNRAEFNDRSPLRTLEEGLSGALDAGDIAILAAAPGTGKTTFLVHVGLDYLLRGERVLHIGIGPHSLDSIQSWYDALFEEECAHIGLDNASTIREEMVVNRVLHAHASTHFSPQQLQATLPLFTACMGFKPRAILIDGYDGGHDSTEFHDFVATLKNTAIGQGASALMTLSESALRIADPSIIEGVDIVLGLKPDGLNARLTIEKAREVASGETPIVLHADSMRLGLDADNDANPGAEPSTFTLLSGAARGAESYFGECAERWGVNEINFSFEDRPVSRERGMLILSEDELRQGAVVSRYLREHMHRSYPDTPLFKKVLQSIWHQVNTAREVFVVGTILEDNTVKGGTGWAAELAKHFGKPLFVYDQERKHWLHWRNREWNEVDPPSIGGRRFTGTGSRFLTDHGKNAIESLFERSYGALPED